MSVKTTGAEFNRYLSCVDPEFWPNGSYYDHDVLIVDGVDTLENDSFDVMKIPNAAKVIIECGTVYKNFSDHEGVALTTHFKRWRKAQRTQFLSVEAPKDKLDAIKAAIVAAGGKVKK